MIAAVEDPLSEAVVRRMVSAVRPDLTIWAVMGNSGNGYLRTKIRELNQTARRVPVMMLTDLDSPAQCPARLLSDWLPVRRNRNLLFRVAVMEVESWVMAHRDAFARFLKVAPARVPSDTDAIANPKEYLVNLARLSRSRDVRSDIVPADGSTTAVGPAYNARLVEFVSQDWNPLEGAGSSESLTRALEALGHAF